MYVCRSIYLYVNFKKLSTLTKVPPTVSITDRFRSTERSLITSLLFSRLTYTLFLYSDRNNYESYANITTEQ